MAGAVTAAATTGDLAGILSQRHMIPAQIMEWLRQRAIEQHKWLGQLAVEARVVTEEELATALAEAAHLPRVDLEAVELDPSALACLDEQSCGEHLMVPFQLSGQTLRVAIANPLDREAEARARALARREVALVVAPLSQVLRALGRGYLAPSSAVAAREDEPAEEALDATPSPQTATAVPAGEGPLPVEMRMDGLLAAMTSTQASDLHLSVGVPPLLRVHGELSPLPYPPLRPAETRAIIYAVLSEQERARFEEQRELDCSYSVAGMGRFRVNVFWQRGSVGAILRAIPTQVPSLEKLNLPAVVRDLTELPRGLVLVTGPTGSGKSTTLAAMINEINQTRRAHIMTIEDPVEFLHKSAQSEINQREVGADTQSFTTALRHVLRQDPDVILIGEMRDLETIAAAVTAAETGHLVFATLHTNSAAQTIDRIIDVFPSGQQSQIRSQLANVLEGVLTQVLVPTREGEGRCCAMEILLATTAVRSLLRDGKTHQITNVMEVSSKQGMQTLDQALKKLVLEGKVSSEHAAAKSTDPEEFHKRVQMG